MGSFLSNLYTHQANMNRPPWKYDVFLCFRGEDTRHGFTNDLRAALRQRDRTFIDDEIGRGLELGPALAQAIRESPIAVVIFSRSFASSTWCLDELVQILECHETRRQVVVPVFYEVNPLEVREQTGNFGEALARHTNVGPDKVRKWRAAMTRVASIQPAWNSRVIRPERMLIDDIIEFISTTLKQKIDEWENDIRQRRFYHHVWQSHQAQERADRSRRMFNMSNSTRLFGSPSMNVPSSFSTPGHSGFARFQPFPPR